MSRSKSVRQKIFGVLARNPKLQYPVSFAYSKARVVKALFRSESIGSDFENFLFIVSCGRSGTTLLRRLLIERYLIYIPPETYVLPDLVRSFMNSNSMEWVDRVAMTLGRFQYCSEFETFGAVDMNEVYRSAINMPAAERTLGGIVKVLFEQFSQQKKVESIWFGDKTPMNTFNLGLVQKIFPRARFAHIVRDPADVIESIVRMGQHGGAKEAAVRWRNSIVAWKNFQDMLPSGVGFELKYEDLVRDVPGTLERMARSFGLPARKERICAVDLLGDVSLRAHHSNVLKPVSPRCAGKGRARLSAEQRRIVGPLVNDLVGLYEYEPI